MVLVIATGHGSSSDNIARVANIRIPHVGNLRGKLSIVRVLLPPMPLFSATENQLTSDIGETFDIPNCSSFAELAVRLSDLRHADASRVVQCYTTGESEFEVCTFANDITLNAAFAEKLNLPVVLVKNSCYDAPVHSDDVREGYATQIHVDVGHVYGAIENGEHSAIVAQFHRGEQPHGVQFEFSEYTELFGLVAKIVNHDGTVRDYPVKNNERFSFQIDIV